MGFFLSSSSIFFSLTTFSSSLLSLPISQPFRVLNDGPGSGIAELIVDTSIVGSGLYLMV